MVKFWDGVPNAPGSHQVGNTQILNDLPGCGGFRTIQVNWQKEVGNHTWYVQVEPAAGETSVNDNTASSTVSIIEGMPKADVAIVKIVDDSTPYAGEVVHYQLTVANNGSDSAYSVVVTDVLPAGVSYKSYSTGQGTYSSSNGKWTVGSLTPGGEVSLILEAEVGVDQIGNSINNSASVSSVGDDEEPSNNTDSVEIVPVAGAPADESIYLPLILK